MKQFSRSHSKAILLKAILSVGSLGLMTGGIAGGTAIATHHHTTSFTSSNKKATPKKAGTGITPNYTASDSNTVDINTIIKDNT
ncbi:hypothetical protein FACS1894166_12200 [Bacilli bacterium]|nr:hypothetical protein FACS1894166_12200 [Bacilli bacterium]